MATGNPPGGAPPGRAPSRLNAGVPSPATKKKESAQPAEANSASGVHRLARELAEATDELNKSLARAESGMVTLNLGVPVEMKISNRTESNDVFLSFRKHDNKWGLYIVRLVHQEGEDDPVEELTPILASSKLIRLRAARALPQLLHNARNEALSQLTAMREGTKAVEAFISSIDSDADFGPPQKPQPVATADAYDDIPGDDEIPF